ncbi:HNH endonuclease [Acidipropionibacterium jensenii]|uniref:HNH endonuclease n=1 Tax=Acidipropionibacterium jensenii TaxID=1749 RepID=A0A3Q9UDY5_9ACTN|nr:HNH endonuclease [Acidipropionibacterium jensenii]
MSLPETSITIIVVLALLPIIYYGTLPIRAYSYFRGKTFLDRRSKVAKLVSEYNDTAKYVVSVRRRQTFEIGETTKDTYSYPTRDECQVFRVDPPRDGALGYGMKQMVNCSRSIVDGVAHDPVKYLTKYKYSGLRADRMGLFTLSRLRDDLGVLEYATHILARDEEKILTSMDVPRYIMKHFTPTLIGKLGIVPQYCDLPYPVFVFEYRSPAGRSVDRATVTLNTALLDSLISEVSRRIQTGRSAAEERSRMTQKLRDQIKRRDDYTCQICGVSQHTSPNLLLEVDHIIPVSRGGHSVPENLQTLCWRCNRRKSNKVLTGVR